MCDAALSCFTYKIVAIWAASLIWRCHCHAYAQLGLAPTPPYTPIARWGPRAAELGSASLGYSSRSNRGDEIGVCVKDRAVVFSSRTLLKVYSASIKTLPGSNVGKWELFHP